MDEKNGYMKAFIEEWWFMLLIFFVVAIVAAIPVAKKRI